MRILIVDDHPMIVEAVTLAIGALRPDAAVQSTASIEEMVASELEPPDLVLLDLTLPGRSGLDALGAVLQRWPATLVVIFSATDDSGSIRRALASGARGLHSEDVAAQGADRRAAAGARRRNLRAAGHPDRGHAPSGPR